MASVHFEKGREAGRQEEGRVPKILMTKPKQLPEFLGKSPLRAFALSGGFC